MRWKWSVASLFLLLAGPAAEADEFTEYRIPEHRRIDWTASLNLDGSRSASGTDQSDLRQRDFRTGGASVLDWLSDSDPARTRLSVIGVAQGSGRWTSSVYRVSPLLVYESDASNENRSSAEIVQLSFEHRRYPAAAPLGFLLAATVGGQYLQQWITEDAQVLQDFGGGPIRDLHHETNENWLYGNFAQAEVSVGWGRVRDASAVYEARVLEDRLRQSGALTRALSDEGRRKLVALLAVRDEYETHRERPVKTLWRRVEEILTDDGALREGGLDAASILRAGENHSTTGLTGDVLPRAPFPRNVGLFVGPLFTDQHSHAIDRFDLFHMDRTFIGDSLASSFTEQAHVHSEAANDDPYLGGRAEIHKPLGMRWQADASSRLLAPVRRRRDGFQTFNQASLAYMVADRWVVTGDVVHRRSLLEEGDQVRADYWTVDYGVAASYYLEDDLQLTLFLREDQTHDTLGFGNRFDRFGRVVLAMSYRVLGRFAAPGVIPAESIRSH